MLVFTIWGGVVLVIGREDCQIPMDVWGDGIVLPGSCRLAWVWSKKASGPMATWWLKLSGPLSRRLSQWSAENWRAGWKWTIGPTTLRIFKRKHDEGATCTSFWDKCAFEDWLMSNGSSWIPFWFGFRRSSITEVVQAGCLRAFWWL